LSGPYLLKRDVATTVTFFCHDSSGDAVTGLTDASFTKRVSKNSGAFEALPVTITEGENGWYRLPFAASDLDTTGIMTIVLTNAGCKQVNLQFRVSPTIVEDLGVFVS
jgi:hypothetical protein